VHVDAISPTSCTSCSMGGLRRQRSVAHSSTPKGPISTCSTMHQSTTTTWSLQCSCSRRLRSDCIFLSRYYHIRELRCIRPYLDFKTASTIATSIVHSKLDYCNSLSYNLSKSQTNRLQVIQNSLARAVVKAPKFCHVTPILKYLYIGLKSTNALNINFFLLPIKLSPLLNLLICTA